MLNANIKVAWSDCCYPKSEGGLGLRDLSKWCDNAILKQVLKLAKPDSSSLWVEWCLKAIVKKKGFWIMRIPRGCPWSLRMILNARSVAMQLVLAVES